MSSLVSGRGNWGSRIGFILAAAGSAIGLGNIWRFPTTVGRSGGAAFVLIYTGFVLLLGLPVMLAELAVGRRTEKNPVGAFKALVPHTAWKYLGGLGVVTGVAILSYYSVIAGWTVGYIVKIAAGEFTNLASHNVVADAFTELIANPTSALGLHALFMALTMLVVLGGVRGGIERWSKILMPILLGILLLLVFRSVTLPGADVGLRFYLQPDFSKVTEATFVSALGQAFFSLSLGMGAMMTYGSYLAKESDLFTCGVWVLVADTAIAILAGFAIFPALFTIPGLEPTEGPGLIFLVLPNIFDKIPGGIFFGTGFFVLLGIAALTSAISLLEVPVAYFIDERGWTRRKAVVVAGLLAFLLGVPSALGNGAVGWLSAIPVIGKSFLDVMDTLFSNVALSFGALLLSIFVGWKWGVADALKEIRFRRATSFAEKSWGFLIRYVCPVAIAIVLANVIRDLLVG